MNKLPPRKDTGKTRAPKLCQESDMVDMAAGFHGAGRQWLWKLWSETETRSQNRSCFDHEREEKTKSLPGGCPAVAADRQAAVVVLLVTSESQNSRTITQRYSKRHNAR